MSTTYFQYNDPIVIVWRNGTPEDPYVDISESRNIINNLMVLTEIPDEFTHVSIDGYTEIYEGVPQEYEFIVNYRNAVIRFHPSQEGKIPVATYKGRGIIQYPAERIYAHRKGMPDVVQNLQEIIDNHQIAIDVEARLAELEQQIRDAIIETDNATENANNAAVYATTQGDYAKEQGDYAKTQGEIAIVKGNIAEVQGNTAEQQGLTAEQKGNTAEQQGLTAEAQGNDAEDQGNYAKEMGDYAKTQGENLKGVGEYDPLKTYYPNNIVMYNHSTYVNLIESTGIVPTNETYWQLALGQSTVQSVNGMTGDVIITKEGLGASNVKDSSINGNILIDEQEANVYTHPETHPASMIVEDENRRFVSDIEKANWNSKQDNLGYVPENSANKNQPNGYAGLDANTKIPLFLLPDTAMQITRVFQTMAERDAWTDMKTGDRAIVIDAGDGSTEGFIWDGTQWLKDSDTDWANVNLDWANIINKPLSSVENIDDAVAKKHSHNNKEILDGTEESYTTAEKNKLAGIEDGATADQTPLEIKTAYESNPDTNAFTDNEKLKLDNIEDGAQVNQNAYSQVVIKNELGQDLIIIDSDSVSDSLSIKQGEGISITQDVVNNGLEIDVQLTDISHGQLGGGNLHQEVTDTLSGFMSSSDKVKIDGIENFATSTPHPVESEEEPTADLSEGLIWYKPSVQETKIYLGGQFRDAGGIKPIISNTEPTGFIKEGTIWYNPDFKETKMYLDGQFRGISGGGLALAEFRNTVTIAETTSVVSHGISQYDKNKDVLFVYQNSTFIQNNSDYNISEDGTQIVKIDGEWEQGTIFNFIVLYSVPANNFLSTKRYTNIVYPVSGSTNIEIGIPEYNHELDAIDVVQSGNVPLIEGLNYTINENGTSIDLIDYTSEEGDAFVFYVLKQERTSTGAPINGSDITDGTIGYSKLSNEAKQDISNNIFNSEILIWMGV